MPVWPNNDLGQTSVKLTCYDLHVRLLDS